MESHFPVATVLDSVHILVVEDDRLMRLLLKDMLSVLGFHNVTTVQDGLEAIDFLYFNQTDIIVCDWKMQGMDGLSLVKYVREKLSGGKRFVPVIMLTGKSEEKDVVEARDSGVTEYLIKPFTIQNLYERLRSVIEQPRSFVVAESFIGPDRRRVMASPPDGMHKRENDKR